MIIILACFASFAGALTVTLNSPADDSWDSDGSVTFNFNVSGAGLTYDCNLWHNFSQAWGLDSSVSNGSVSNDSATDLVKSSISDQVVGLWNVRCEENGDATNFGWAAANYTVKLDSTDPVVVIGAPTNNEWFSTSTGPRIQLTATDTNPNNCLLHGTFNTSINETMPFAESIDTYAYTSGTAFNFTIMTVSNAWTDNSTDAYRWNYTCNDDAGNAVSGTGYGFWVDTTAPSGLLLSNILVGSTSAGWFVAGNNSDSTDYTPNVNWTVPTEINHSHYHVKIRNSSNILIYNANVTILTQNNHTVATDLQADDKLTINVTAYDLAGNSETSDYPLFYTPDSTCHTLSAGWNLCAYINDAEKNATTICDEVECDYIAKYNRTHGFQIFENGTTTDEGMVFDSTQTVNASIFIYVSVAKTWDTRIWGANQTDYYVLTNASTEGWNIIPFLQQSDRSLGNLYFNSTNADPTSSCVMTYNSTGPIISEFALYSNAGQNFTGHTGNFTVGSSAGLNVEYGECVWAFLDYTASGLSSFTWNSTNNYNATTNCHKW